jgi:hypothetical protein
MARPVGAARQRRRLTGVGRYRCSGPMFLMRSWPKGWREVGTHLGGSRAVVVAGAVGTMGCSSSSSSVTVRASSSGAPAHSWPQAASPWSPQAPPSLQLRRAVVNRSSLKFLLDARVWFLQIKIRENRPLFIGLLVWTRRVLGVLQFLSINQTLIRLHLEDFWKENELGLVTIRKPNSRLG